MPDFLTIDLNAKIPNEVRSGFNLFLKIHNGQIKTIFREDLEKIEKAFMYYCSNDNLGRKPKIVAFLTDVANQISVALKDKKDMWLVEISDKENCVSLI